MSRLYSEAHTEWVSDNIKNCSSIQELYELSIKELGWNISLVQFRSFLKNHKINTGYKKTKADSKVYWNKQRVEWLRKNVPGRSRVEVLELWNKEHPEEQLTINQIIGAMKNNHITNGRNTRFEKGHKSVYGWKKGQRPSIATEFKKGNKPHNQKPIGTISVRTDKNGIPYRWIKIDENKWEMYHRHIWKQSYGEVPNGMVITFKDGNQEHCEIDNLALITREENVAIMHFGMTKNRTPEQFEAIKTITNIGFKIKELQTA